MSSPVVIRQPVGSVIVRLSTQGVVVGESPRALVVLPSTPKTIVVAVGHQGPSGIQGPIGPAGGQAISRVAGQTISALRVVYEGESGAVHPLDPTDEAHIFSLLGVTLTAADAGLPVNVQRSGVVDDSSWHWAPGQRVYLGVNGALTVEPAEEGFHVLIGTALSPTRLLLNLQDPVQLWPALAQGD